MRRAALVLALAAAGCGPAASTAPPPKPGYSGPSIDVEATRWLPAKDDVVYAYETRDLVAKTTGVFMLRSKRIGADRIDLVGPKRTEHLVYKPDGILREREGTYLLKTPVTEGATWPGGPNATLKFGRVGTAVKVLAGDFDRCAEVVEQRSGAIKGTITTTFCPDVGIVSIETLGEGEGTPIHERVELKSYSQAVDIGAPGTSKSTTGPLAGRCPRGVPVPRRPRP